MSATLHLSPEFHGNVICMRSSSVKDLGQVQLTSFSVAQKPIRFFRQPWSNGACK